MFNFTALEKYKLQLQWDIITHPLEWQHWKSPAMPSVGNDVEQTEILYTAGGNMKWYNFGK